MLLSLICAEPCFLRHLLWLRAAMDDAEDQTSHRHHHHHHHHNRLAQTLTRLVKQPKFELHLKVLHSRRSRCLWIRLWLWP